MRDSGISLADRYREVRRLTEALAAPLCAEDQVVQSMPDVSPTKWHRSHVTWFFETFVLGPHAPGYTPLDPRYGYLFNSYYEQAGERHPRPQRGLLSRPTVREVGTYRAHVDDAMDALFDTPGVAAIEDLVVLGLHHEQQHQELLLMDIKHVLSVNPLRSAYRSCGPSAGAPGSSPAPLGWVTMDGGLHDIGQDPAHDPARDPAAGFAYDNEGPRHTIYLRPFAVADRLVTNGEWLEFMDDGGYRRPTLWLSDGWHTRMAQGWEAPLYWEPDPGSTAGTGWQVFTLDGLRPLRLDEPVCHVSHYEADAYARWAGYRLPTEAEWEVVAATQPGARDPGTAGNQLAAGHLHPAPDPLDGAGVRQLIGDVWEWTSSPYVGYPGYRPVEGAIGEYNGKFMSNQMVLRGGCCVTPPGHVRLSYRNFFPSHSRWAFSGLRLASDI